MSTYLQDAAPSGDPSRFVVTPTLKKKLHWPLVRLGVDEDIADELAADHNIKQVGDILRWEWTDIPIAIREALQEHGFTMSGKHVQWVEQRIWTKRMQNLTGCSPEEIGVDLRNCNALEEARGVKTIGELLKLKLEQLDNVPHLANKGKQQVIDCLAKAGFVAGPNIVWIKEEDTAEYQKRLAGVAVETDEDADDDTDDWGYDDFGDYSE